MKGKHHLSSLFWENNTKATYIFLVILIAIVNSMWADEFNFSTKLNMHILNSLTVVNIIRPLIRKWRKHNSQHYEDILNFLWLTHLGRWGISNRMTFPGFILSRTFTDLLYWAYGRSIENKKMCLFKVGHSIIIKPKGYQLILYISSWTVVYHRLCL